MPVRPWGWGSSQWPPGWRPGWWVSLYPAGAVWSPAVAAVVVVVVVAAAVAVVAAAVAEQPTKTVHNNVIE